MRAAGVAGVAAALWICAAGYLDAARVHIITPLE